MMNRPLQYRRGIFFLSIITIAFYSIASCQFLATDRSSLSPTALPSTTPAPEVNSLGLTQVEIDSLNSLQKVDAHPLFVMHYQGPHRETTFSSPEATDLQRSNIENNNPPLQWACSLFAALADPKSGVFGRNFDWEFSPALLLFTDPPDGYASVSMVDLAYIFDKSDLTRLMDLDLIEREPLLNTPFMPFDGLNEKGLAVGMAAVPHSPMPNNPNNRNVDSLRIIRMILDQSANVEEALAIMRNVNIVWDNGPPLHYLLADISGTAALVEFVEGEMIVHYNTSPWHQATNFLISNANGPTDGICNRYDLLTERLREEQGDLSLGEAMELLADVSQSSTQWSVVYQLHTGRIFIAMGRRYAEVHAFQIENSALED